MALVQAGSRDLLFIPRLGTNIPRLGIKHSRLGNKYSQHERVGLRVVCKKMPCFKDDKVAPLSMQCNGLAEVMQKTGRGKVDG